MKRYKIFISLFLIQLFFFNFSFAQINSKSQLPVNLQNGLVAFYPFNGNAGDSSGNGNHGNIFGSVSPIADRNGFLDNAYFWPSSGSPNNYISIPDLTKFFGVSYSFSDGFIWMEALMMPG
jgi:hypothetical protein